MTILAVAHDPGGASVVAATVDTLRRQGQRVRALVAGPARSRFAVMGVACEEAPAVFAGDDEAQLLLAGTSAVAPLEREAMRWAAAGGVRSLALIDYWAHYRMRFAPSGAPDGPAVFPDLIAALDETSAREMIADGVPSDRVRVIGQPYFGWLLERVNAAGDRAGPVLFASEPGADEVAALRRVVEALSALPSPPALVIRFHPRQTEREASLNLLATTGIRHRVDDAANPHDTVRGCRAVLGIGSVLLIEAALLGVPAASVDPEARLATIRTEFTPGLATTAEIRRFVTTLPPPQDDAFIRTHRGAHERAAALCTSRG